LYQKAVAQKAESADLVGEIYLGAGETESFSYIADRIKEFRKSHPKVVFHIISENADEIRADIDKGVLDLGFVMRSGNLERYHQLEIDRWESWGAIVPLEHPLAQNKSITGQALLQYPLILPENQAFQKQLIGWLDGEPEIAVTYNLIRNALPFVKNGTGLVLCLNDPALTESGLCFVPLRPAHVVSPVLIWKKHVVQSPVIQVFLKTLGYSCSE
ncbi:MAG: LysR family transcriptional regulator substrate-binding protein, partial [Firmicutes bacterium]|nr:LysR family transcriptional regulator substrate-binding protein [Bacillota bacterium]